MRDQNWFVVHTKPKQEALAVENLQRQGYTVYCPQTILPKRQRHGWKNVVEPLFPRYLFVQLNTGIDNFSPIRSTPGVVGLVRFGYRPAIMQRSAIEAIKKQECNFKNVEGAHPNWQNGDILEIVEGPFAGLRGIFQKKAGIERAMLLLDILGQQNHLAISMDYLAPAM